MDATGSGHDRRFSRLSLIDFASEDDFLLYSPSADLHPFDSFDFANEDQEHESIRKLETVDFSRREDRTDGFEPREDEPELRPSLEQDRIKRNEKYNLSKSLAWDCAFFNSAGFLEPEELTSMVAPVSKNEKRVLPIIAEDVHKSSDSISTLESEVMPLECIEGSLLEDVRASNQKSSRIIGKAGSRIQAESRTQEQRKSPSSGRLDLTSQNKIKKTSASKQTDGLQGPGRTIKQNSSQPRSGQQLKPISKVPLISTSTKRPSIGATVNDRITSGPGPADRLNSVSLRATTTHKLSRLSTAGKREPTTSSEVSVSSSEKVGKSSSKDVRRKTQSPSSGSIQKTQSRVASKVKTPIASSRLSSYLISQTKHSSGMSPASSISEWSTESSSKSGNERRSCSSKASLSSSSSKQISIDNDASHDGRNHAVGPHTQTAGLLPQSIKKTSSQSSALPPASLKPSGLRLPSPKIGYFDGGKTSTTKSNPSVPGGSTKIGAGNGSTIGGQNKTKPSKLQPARVLPKSTTRANIQPNKNSKSHKPTATKMSKTNKLDQEVEEHGCEGSNTNLHDSDVCANSSVMRENRSKENKAGSNANEMKTTNNDGEPKRSLKFRM